MFNYKLKFMKKKDVPKMTDEEFYEFIDDCFSVLSNNGQVIGGFEVYTNEDSMCASTVLPMEDSLSEAYNSVYVKERFKKLQEIFDIEIIQEGINIEYHSSCMCEKPSWYFLYNEGNLGESPLVCGECQQPVPLYRVPYIRNENDHYLIKQWQKAKTAMDSLYFYGLWDRFTYGENVLPKSKLNREGRKICKDLEKVLKMPVYHFIYYVCEPCDEENMIVPKGLPHEIPKVCPQCGGNWIEDSDFCRCKKCRLITDSPHWKKERNLL